MTLLFWTTVLVCVFDTIVSVDNGTPPLDLVVAMALGAMCSARLSEYLQRKIQ